MKRYLFLFNSYLNFITNKIDASVSINNETASLFRIIFSLFTLLLFCPNYTWLSNVPQTLFNPLFFNISRIYGSFPSEWYLKVSSYLILISITFVGVGIKTRFFARLCSFLLIINNSFVYSFGKIDHGILLPVTLLCLSFSNWGIHYAIIPDKKSVFHSKAYHVLALCLVFGMMSAASGKLIVWLDFDLTTNGFLSWFYKGYFSVGNTYLLADIVLKLSPFLVECFDYTAIVFEISPLLFLLAGKRYWLIWLIIAIIFHITNTLLLNIPFGGNSIVYLSFIISNYKIKVSRFIIKGLNILILISFSIILVQRSFLGVSDSFLLVNKVLINKHTILLVFLILWTILLFVGLHALIKKD